MYKFLLCSRYLRTRFIALASIISVMLGVATMIVVNSVMAGFSTQMRDRIHGILADMVLEANSTDGAPNPEAVMARVREIAGDKIEAMTPVVEVYGMASFEWMGQRINKVVTLVGIDPQSKAQVGPLAEYLGAYQAVQEDGQIVKPAARSLNEPPNWDLLPQYIAYRRKIVDQRRWMRRIESQHGDDVESTGTEKAAGEQPVAVGAEDPLLQELLPGKTQKELSVEEEAAPLPGRIYVGQGVVSFLREDKKGKQVLEMMAQPGDDITIATLKAGREPAIMGFNATIVDVFKCGMSEYDSSFIFCNLEHLQQMRGMFDRQTGERYFTTIQIRLKDYSDAAEVSSKLLSSPYFPPGLFSVHTWEDKQGPLLAAVSVEQSILNVLLFLIIAVAGFGILAIFYMIVVEKTRDIGIMKALGAGSGGIQAIFMGYGLCLGIVGAGVGVVAGLLFVWNINWIESWITYLTGVKVFNDRIYYFPVIPTSVDPLMVFWVAAGAMAIAVLASILPARRAAAMHPVQCLRYE